MTDDLFALQSDSLSSPARRAFAIVPHVADPLQALPKAIYVGTGGTLVLRAVGSDADVTFKNLANGQIIDVRASHVRATGTTAADIIGLA